jgi:hypothetical protein
MYIKSEVIVTEINSILDKHGIKEKIKFKNLTITDKTIMNFSSDSTLSNLIANHCWSPVMEENLFHFTNENAAYEIMQSNTLRLYSISKRYTDGEIKTFLQDFNFNYALNNNTLTDEMKDFNNNIFYISFTNKSMNEAKKACLKHFTTPHGARLEFKIKSSNNNLRVIHYQKGKQLLLFKDLQTLAEKYNRKFLFTGISSRFAAFYIPSTYQCEDEIRLLYRNWGKEIVQNDGKHNFIELKFDENNLNMGVDISLIECVYERQQNNLLLPKIRIGQLF